MPRHKKISAKFYPEALRIAALPYPAVAVPDGEFYVAYDLLLKNCMGQGDTAQEALADLALARVDFIALLLEIGQPVPQPQPTT